MFEPNIDAVPIVEAFFQSHDAGHFAENAEWIDYAQGIALQGRNKVVEQIQYWYRGNFCEPEDEPLNLMEVERVVIAEWVFRARACRSTSHTKGIAVPVIGLFKIEGRLIRQLRLYYNAMQLNGGIR